MNENSWRLIKSPSLPGGDNMAIDEAILKSVIEGESPPTLRLFAWEPYCLSLGHAQAITEINLDFLSKMSWGLVRRPTGGRAIFHADELTYSVCAPLENPHVKGGVIESYRKISSCLLEALRIIGISADSLPKNEEKKHLSKDPVCFQYPSDYEITFGGKKLIGSAQARRANALLQHGSIPLSGDITRIISTLNFKSASHRDHARGKLARRATTISTIRGKDTSWAEMASAMIDAFEKTFSIEFTPGPLSATEISDTESLIKEKYMHLSWTNRI